MLRPRRAERRYSARSEMAGSTRVARRAGIELASTAEATSTAAVAASVSGSVMLTSLASRTRFSISSCPARAAASRFAGAPSAWAVCPTS